MKKSNSTKSPPESDKALRLEWIDPRTLTANPRNWRTHPPEQISALSAAMNQTGWAGACLYNLRTKRLIDGHARVKVAIDSGAAAVPVLVGDWDEATEAKILLTLDPLSEMAEVDSDALRSLLDSVGEQGEALQGLLDGLSSRLPIDFEDPPETIQANAAELKEIAEKARAAANAGVISKNDTEKYLVVVFKTRKQRESLLTSLGLPVEERYVQAIDLSISARRRLAPVKNDRDVTVADQKNSGAGG